MIIYNKSLSVVPLTTHINLRKVPKIIKKNLIITKIRTLNNFYRKYFKVKPKIAILGLNPHNAEYNKDSEEIKFIKPAINSLKKRFNVSGPYSADTAFGKAHLKKFNRLFLLSSINLFSSVPKSSSFSILHLWISKVGPSSRPSVIRI